MFGLNIPPTLCELLIGTESDESKHFFEVEKERSYTIRTLSGAQRLLSPSSRFINNKRIEEIMNHYVYYSYEDWGRGYIGVRQCECNIYEDEYFGSYYDNTFNPTNKIILMKCNNRKEALEAEVIIHNFYDVKNNPHFANQANQTSSKFDYDNTGIPVSEETRKKISKTNQGHLKGTKQSPEQIAKRIQSRKNGGGWSKETGKKISKSLKGNIPWNKGKKVGPMSEEQKEKIKNTMLKKFRQRNDDGTFISSSV